MRRLAIAFILLSSAAHAQEMPPIDRDLWQAMGSAISNLSMPLSSHEQAQQIIANVERQAAQRKAQKDAAAAAKAQEAPKP
jgi:hypothetical protein